MSSALDEGSVILVSSVAHLRDGNRAFKVWNEHSSSVLPSRWGKEIKKKIWWWHFNNLHYDNDKLKHKERNIIWHLQIFQQLHCLLHKNNITYLHLINNYFWNYSLMATQTKWLYLILYKRAVYKTRCSGADKKVILCLTCPYIKRVKDSCIWITYHAELHTT